MASRSAPRTVMWKVGMTASLACCVVDQNRGQLRSLMSAHECSSRIRRLCPAILRRHEPQGSWRRSASRCGRVGVRIRSRWDLSGTPPVTTTNTSRDDGELHSSSSTVLRHCCVTDPSQPPDQTALRSLIGMNDVVDVGDRRRRPQDSFRTNSETKSEAFLRVPDVKSRYGWSDQPTTNKPTDHTSASAATHPSTASTTLWSVHLVPRV